MIYVTSDLHGYDLNLFLDFLKRSGFDEERDRLIVLGDVIDGNSDGGISLLRWMMNKPFATLLRGNHEEIMLSFQNLLRNAKNSYLGKSYPGQLIAFTAWVNGDGTNTFLALKELAKEDPEEVGKVLDYVANARHYLEVTAGGKNYVLVHSGLKNFSPKRPLSDYKLHELIVARPGLEDRYYEDKTVIFGHTPTERLGNKGRMVMTETWIDIDTGAGHGGTPMLLRLDDLKAFYV